MRSLFLFIGFGIGVWLHYASTVPIYVCLLILILANATISFKKGSLKLFGGALLFGFLFSFIGSWVDSTKTSLTGVVVESKTNYFIFQSAFCRYYVYSKNNSYEVGDILKIEGKVVTFTSTSYEGYFSFGDYLSSKGVKYQFYSYKTSSIFSTPIRLKEKETNFLSQFDTETSAFLNALLFNQKDYNSSLIALTQSLSLLSIFSNSGLVYSAILRAFHKIVHLNLKDKNADRLTLIIASILLPLSFYKIGILRVYLTRVFSYINSYHLHSKFNRETLISTSGVLLGLLDFHYFYQTSFLIGYFISLSLQYAKSFLSREKPRKKRWLTRGLIFVFILPFSLSEGYFHPFYYLFSLILMPGLTLASFLGYLSFFSVPFLSLLKGIYQFFYKIISIISIFDFKFSFPRMNQTLVLGYYLILIQSLIFWDVGMKKLRDILYYGFLVIYLFSFLPFHYLYRQSVTFINVGQGDSILIQDHQYSVLIDTGGNTSFDMAEEVVIPYLYSQRVYHLDYLITTHDDADHAGAKDSLIKNFKVGQYLDSVQKLDIGDLHFNNLNIYGGEDENDQSIVFYLEFMGSKWIFMGDASTEIESKILSDYPDLDVDYIKVGHHGSSTSSSYSFLKQLSPKEAIISVGAKNSYGHPSQEVLDRLESLNIKIRRTDLEGTISYQNFVSWV